MLLLIDFNAQVCPAFLFIICSENGGAMAITSNLPVRYKLLFTSFFQIFNEEDLSRIRMKNGFIEYGNFAKI